MGIVEFLKEEKFLMEDALAAQLKDRRRNAYSGLGRAKITVLYGLRGTGKTTLLAQKYAESKERLAIHGEHLNLAEYSIKDMIPQLRHVISEGHLFIDEITKLDNWAEELKVLSDLHPKLKIIITGSSAVDLQNARRTLARRAVFINLPPLTLNEFLNIKYGVNIPQFDPFSKDPLTGALKAEQGTRKTIPDIGKLIHEYKGMNLPYLLENPDSTLLDVIDRVIYEDIGGSDSFTEDILGKYWPLLKLLALSEKTSYDALSRDLGLGKGTVIKMIGHLLRAKLVKAVYPYAHGKGKVRKEAKYLFTSPTIRNVILNLLGERERAVGLGREDLFAMQLDDFFYLKAGPDYVWKNTLFEVGGPGKGTEQFRNLPFKMKKYVIHEGVEIQGGDVFRLPFYLFLSYF